MTLNKEQDEALIRILDFIEAPFNEDVPFFTLTGGPGTGKTFMLNEVISQMDFRLRVAAATIGHSAKNVLQGGLGAHVHYFTIAKLLNMHMKEDGSDDFEIRKGIRSNFGRYDIIILDEISMINDKVYDIIMEEVRRLRVRLITVGDAHQLPPVGQEHDCHFFDHIGATLIQSMRFQGPIQTLVKAVELEIDNINQEEAFDPYIINEVTQRKGQYDKTLQSGYSFTSSMNTTLAQAAREFKNKSFNPNHTRLLAFKKSTVKNANNHIRKLITDDDSPPPFLKDEILISNKNFLYNSSIPLIHNGQILQVKTFTQRVDNNNIPIISLTFYDLDIPWGKEVKIIDPFDEQAVAIYDSQVQKRRDNGIKDPRQWPEYYGFIAEYAEFDYAYAVNAYKAQGQTIENVYVFEKEIVEVKPLSWKQKFQALYVAMTRASKKLIIFNEDY